MNTIVKKLAGAVIMGACTYVGMYLAEEACNTMKDPHKKAVAKQKLDRFKSKVSEKLSFKVKES